MIRASLLLLSFLGIAIPEVAEAFVRSRAGSSGQCLQWEERVIPWAMNERGHPSLGYERAHRAFQRSFQTWEDVECTDLVFRDQSPTAETRVGHREGDVRDNLVIFRAEDCRDVAGPNAPCHKNGTCANEYDCWEHGSSVIAVTTTTYYRGTGQIVDADIEMNAAWFDFTDVDGPPCPKGESEGCVATDIQNTATHEIGHMLGLDHSSVREATMYASASRGETGKRRLSEDDIEGICSIYPAGKPPVYCAEFELEEAPGGCDCASGGGGIGNLGLLLAGFALLWRRQASRPSRG